MNNARVAIDSDSGPTFGSIQKYCAKMVSGGGGGKRSVNVRFFNFF